MGILGAFKNHCIISLIFLFATPLMGMDGTDFKYFETLEKLHQGSIDSNNLGAKLNNYELYQELKDILTKIEKNLEIENLIDRQIENEKILAQKDIQELFQYIYGIEYFLVKSPFRELLLGQIYHFMQIHFLNLKKSPNKVLKWIKDLPKYPKDIENNLLILLTPILSDEFTYEKVKEEDIVANADKSILLVKREDGLAPTLLYSTHKEIMESHLLSRLEFDHHNTPINSTQLPINEKSTKLIDYIGNQNGTIIVAKLKEVIFNTAFEKLVLFKKNENTKWTEIIELKNIKIEELVDISDNGKFVLLKSMAEVYSIFNIHSNKVIKIKFAQPYWVRPYFVGNKLYSSRYSYSDQYLYFSLYEVKEDSIKLIERHYAINPQKFSKFLEFQDCYLLNTINRVYRPLSTNISNCYRGSDIQFRNNDHPLCFSKNGFIIGSSNDVYIKIFRANENIQSKLTITQKKSFKDILYSVFKSI